MLRSDADGFFTVREDIARRYLRGSGIEIGAFAHPLRVPKDVRVRYVDHLPREELLRINADVLRDAGIAPSAVPNVDVVDSAESLASFDDGSQDFVIANHVVEHLPDPIGALSHMLRVIRPNGVIFLAVPDARYTFDAPRARTSIEHLVRDHADGPELSRAEHYAEWAHVNEGLVGEAASQRIQQFEANDERHHFHVWELESFVAFLGASDLPVRIELAQLNPHEFVVVGRRCAP